MGEMSQIVCFYPSNLHYECGVKNRGYHGSQSRPSGRRGTGASNNSGGNDCVDSVITQAGGNIGIGTTTPAATLDVVGGNVNLEASTATSGNMLKGGVPFLHNYGDVNTFLGLNAGNLTTTGFRNTGSGWNALYSNTAGNNNTANGVNALCFNTTGYNNTTIGAAALFSNDTGFENTAIGDRADVQGNLFNATAIGVGAIVNASNKIRLGNFDVTVVEDSP